MALNASKSLIGAAVVCGIIAAVYLPPRGTVPTYRSDTTPARLRLRVAEDSLRRAVEAHDIERRRDAVRAWLATHPGDSLVAYGFGAESGLERIAEQEWSQVGAAHPMVRPVIVYAAGSAANYAGVTVPPATDVAVLPEAMGSVSCAGFVARAPRRKSASTERFWRADVRRTLGPCAFHAVYGMPGRPIARWLAARQYDLAATTLLGAAGGHLAPPDPDRSVGDILRMFGVERGDEGISLNAVACLRGNAERCAAAVLSPRTAGSAPAMKGVVKISPVIFRSEFGGAEANYLADLAREIGPKRFAAFWQSDAEVYTAFSDAVGRPIGDWTRDWARRRMRSEGGGRLMTAGVAVESLLIAAVLSLVAGVIVRRWKVT